MSSASLTQQGSTAPAPPAQAPAIPALPAQPGASTGGAAAQDIAREVGREVAREVRTQVQQATGAAGQGTSTTQPPDLPFDPATIIPPQVVPLTAMSLAMIVVIFIGWPISRAFARRMDRRAELGTMRASDLEPKIRQLQESLDTMAVELERISEAQRFQAKLLSERSASRHAEGQ